MTRSPANGSPPEKIRSKPMTQTAEDHQKPPQPLTHTVPANPIVPDSYWVTAALAAGPYPGLRDPAPAEARIATFERSGVSLFVDLTAEGDFLEPYDHLLRTSSRVWHPIPDMGVTTPEKMVDTLDTIDTAHARGDTVYVHCWGGIGRTGSVVGCWLVRHGSSATDAIELIRRRRLELPVFQHFPKSPQTSAQERFVAAWQAGM